MPQGYRDKIVKAFEKQLIIVYRLESDPTARKEKAGLVYSRFLNILSCMVDEGILTLNACTKITDDLDSVCERMESE